MNSIINQEIRIKDFLPLFIIPKIGSKKKLDLIENEDSIILKSRRCKEIVLNKKIILHKNDLMAIGLYFAEGDKHVNLNKKYHHSGEISFVNNEIECLNLIISLLEKLGISKDKFKWRIDLNIKHSLNSRELINYWIDNLKLNKLNKRPKWIYRTGNLKTKLCTYSSEYGCFHIYYSSTVFRNFFLNFINEIFDTCIIYQLKKELALILEGFFAGDGNVDYNKKYNRKQVEFSNNNLKLLNKIRKSLEILGLKSIKETWPEKTKTHSKALRIYNKNDFDILNKYKIPFLLSYKKEKFMQIINSY